MPTGRDLHIDTPLTNVAVQAFLSSQNYIAPDILPVVTVDKQSNKYYVLDRDSWLMMPATTRRAPKVAPRRVDWKISSDSFYCENFALAHEMAQEDLANADLALDVRARSTEFVSEMLLRDYEQRVATMFTNTANFNASVVVSGATGWTSIDSADIMAQVQSGHSYIRGMTGQRANTLITDYDSYVLMRRNSRLTNLFKYTDVQGMLDDNQLTSILQVDRIVVGDAIKNTAGLKAGTSVFSSANIWGGNAILCYLAPATTLKAITFAAAFRWTPAGMPGPFAVYRYPDPDPGKKVEVVEVGYYQDEKVLAKDLGYLIAHTHD